MSYELRFFFDPPLSTNTFLAFFAQRRNYTARKDQVTYQNIDTGVSFVVHYQANTSPFTKGKTAAARIEVNYGRPRFFAMEAEIEIAALVAQFSPRIADPQTRGMGDGPYSNAGFLNGWNFGNALAIDQVISNNPDDRHIASLPAATLQAAWSWNYKKAELLQKIGNRQFVPKIMLVTFGNKPCLATVWALGMPILLPKVDLVLVAREGAGVQIIGLCPWSEITQILASVGIDTIPDPIDIQYPVTPALLAQWIATRPAIDLNALPQLRFETVLDTDLAVRSGSHAETQPRRRYAMR